MLVIPISSELYTIFNELAQTKRMVFVTGLPGVGKSLLIQQLTFLAEQAGRTIHLMQWDVSRKAFETPEILAKYPEIDGVTDPMIRKAVGMWSRQAVAEWDAAHGGDEHLLIGELPLLGNRLSEMIERVDDACEPLLRAESTEFIVPVPSWEVRAVIEQAREKTIANPQHEKEKMDASPDVLRTLWQDVNDLARQMKLTKTHADSPYNPYIYGGVYDALLQNRHRRLVLIEEVLRPRGSVYESGVVTSVLEADPAQVVGMIAALESAMTRAELEASVEKWHEIITKNPKTYDAGPELRLPLPEQVVGIEQRTHFSPVQKAALNALVSLPLDADAKMVRDALATARVALAADLPEGAIQANVEKFDIYDSYFNVTRTAEQDGIVFVHGLLQSYANVLENMAVQEHGLTIVELPMLRIALEMTLRIFDLDG